MAGLRSRDRSVGELFGHYAFVERPARIEEHAQGDVTTLAHLDENLAARSIELSPDDLKKIDDIFPRTGDAVIGDRYPHMNMTYKYNPK